MISYRYLALASLCVGSLLSVGAVSGTKKVSLLQRLLSNDVTEIKEAQNELLTARKDLIARLINIVKNNENRLKRQASVRAAMFILGEMRAVEATEALIDHIGFPYVYEYTGESIPVDVEGGTLQRGIKGFQRTYPAIKALIKIGEPCIGAIITKLASTENVNEEKACLGVLVELRQRDFVIGLLKDTINKETDPKKRDRLQSGLDLIQQMEG